MASIRIVQLNGTTVFQPDVLEVDRGDDVTWNNRTKRPHWPWPIDADGNLLSEADAIARKLYLSDRIPAGQVSIPIYNVDPIFSPPPPLPDVNVPPPQIKYVCRLHLQEQGSIVVRNP